MPLKTDTILDITPEQGLPFSFGRAKGSMRIAVKMLLILFCIFLAPSVCLPVNEHELLTALLDRILPFYYQQLQHGEFKGRENLPIYYAKLEVPQEKGALIIVSGRGESCVKYAELIYDLRQVGFSIYTLDHRGQGFSGRMLADPLKGHVERFDNYVADLKTFIDTVVNTRSHPRRFLLAHSMGGAVAAIYAARHINDLDGLILSSPMLKIEAGPVSQALMVFMLRIFISLGKAEDYIYGSKMFNPEAPFAGNNLTHSQVRYEMNKTLRSCHPEIKLGAPTNRWSLEAIEATRRARKAASKIRIPVLLLEAEDDTVVGLSGLEEFHRLAENSIKISFNGSYHEILMERDEIRDKAKSRILKFLEQHTPVD
ncbi:MAG: alpha/beta fold hydrolase [Desulfobacterales bacterium]